MLVVVSVTSCGFKELLACSVPNVLSWIQVCAFDERRSGFCGATLKTLSYLRFHIGARRAFVVSWAGQEFILWKHQLSYIFTPSFPHTKDAGCSSACEMRYAAEFWCWIELFLIFHDPENDPVTNIVCKGNACRMALVAECANFCKSAWPGI